VKLFLKKMKKNTLQAVAGQIAVSSLIPHALFRYVVAVTAVKHNHLCMLPPISRLKAPATTRVYQAGATEMKTYSPKASELTHKWYLVDAKDKVLGRLATEIATRLRGKHKAEFAPHMDNGDFIIVINADKIKVTGQKATQKTYYRYTGYVGGLRETTLEEMMVKSPETVITKAVKGMLPKSALGFQLIKKLKVYTGTEHPHQAQQPEVLDI
jgi:large subunit ribosomal protein L13